jgi:hypothetical protein
MDDLLKNYDYYLFKNSGDKYNKFPVKKGFRRMKQFYCSLYRSPKLPDEGKPMLISTKNCQSYKKRGGYGLKKYVIF